MEISTAPVHKYVDAQIRVQSIRAGDLVMSPMLVDQPIAFILHVTPDRGFGWVQVTFMDAETHDVSMERISVGIKYDIRRYLTPRS